ncbi:MAG: hypothetical protein H7Y31_13200 [Chitinophagaceae bacterium]|nr:hypothetical protein [Chitinophagaceae bacterium]
MDVILMITTTGMLVLLTFTVLLLITGFLTRRRNLTTLMVGGMKDGIEASAILLSVEETGVYLNHRPQIKMQMQVIPEKGRNFVAEAKEIVSIMDLAALRTGTMVTVKYNPANNREIELVKR